MAGGVKMVTLENVLNGFRSDPLGLYGTAETVTDRRETPNKAENHMTGA